jgi:hypothetical protein
MERVELHAAVFLAVSGHGLILAEQAVRIRPPLMREP